MWGMAESGIATGVSRPRTIGGDGNEAPALRLATAFQRVLSEDEPYGT